MTDVEGREVLGCLIVGLDGGQFISELLATVELPDFREVNFGKPVLHLRVLFIGDHRGIAARLRRRYGFHA